MTTPQTPLRIAVAGASGRMGHMLIEAVNNDPHAQLVGALDVASSPAIGSDATAFLGHSSGVTITSVLRQGLAQAQVLIVGGLEVSYGSAPAGGGNWKDVLLAELAGQLDLSRVHFVGKIPHGLLHQLFRVCACHVYLTYPFVLSWSLLEAMACGSLVIGSATPPVQDVIRDGVNGHLVDFFDAEALARRIAAVLADPASQLPLRAEARRHVVERFDLQTVCLPQQLALVDRLLG